LNASDSAWCFSASRLVYLRSPISKRLPKSLRRLSKSALFYDNKFISARRLDRIVLKRPRRGVYRFPFRCLAQLWGCLSLMPPVYLRGMFHRESQSMGGCRTALALDSPVNIPLGGGIDTSRVTGPPPHPLR
jgi:hypothetical protein